MANAFKSYVSGGVGTSPITVYTTPALTKTTIIGLSVANITASQITVSATLTKGATTVYLVKDCPVPVGSSAVLVGGDQKIVCEAADTVKVTASVATSTDVIISMLEIA